MAHPGCGSLLASCLRNLYLLGKDRSTVAGARILALFRSWIMALSRRRLLSAMHLGGLTVREAAIRTWKEMQKHETLTRAAAISFYAIAALVPFLALVITLTAWFFPWIAWLLPAIAPQALDSETARTAGSDAFSLLQKLLPADAASVISRELATLQRSRRPAWSRSA